MAPSMKENQEAGSWEMWPLSTHNLVAMKAIQEQEQTERKTMVFVLRVNLLLFCFFLPFY
jgi:hypothetical protein